MIVLDELLSEVFHNFTFGEVLSGIPLTANHDQYVYVDGEESDHGSVEYFHNGELFGTREILGGDVEYTELTSYGKSIVADVMITRINDWKAS